ncbi:threonine/serine ThrE exporter family protein [Kocuria dechangensis]|uniref:threonine/serine ThrE exporter family protein n=1 Tax=Kocuria dechangensis TaxID=1176249 RepID=UPI001E6367A4|nr:threonine/serine exporter family protein [Kocuria dechangensis]
MTDQRTPLRPFAAYPSSDAGPEPAPELVEPFGPGGDTGLTGAARPAALGGTGLPPVRPTETQALEARRRAGSGAQDVVPDAPQPLPVLDARLIREHRGDAAPGPAAPAPEPLTAAQTVPRPKPSKRRRRTGAGPVSRPDTTAIGPVPEPGKSADRMQRGAYPSTRAEGARPDGRARLRSILRGDSAPTAPMRAVERLSISPFANLRRFGEATSRDARRTLNFALRLAETMFHYGADALDVENAIVAVCTTYGVENVEVDITNQAVTINYIADGTDPTADGGGTRTREDVFNDPDTSSHTVMRVVRSWTDNYAGLGETHQLVADITGGEMPRAEAERRLDEINAKPKPYAKWMVWTATVVAAMAITAGIGGGPTGALVAGLTSILVQVVSHRLGTWRIPEFFAMAANSGIVTTAALLVSWSGLDLSPPRVIAGGIIMLLPTTRMVSTMQDAINGFPVTAAGRLLSTAMAFLGIIAGIAGGVSVAAYLGMPRVDVSQSVFDPPDPVVNTAFMVVATALVAVTMQTKPRHVLATTAAALGGLVVYHAGVAAGLGARLDTALAAVVSGCVATVLAARHRIPQLVVAIPAMTFLLPGLSIFRGMYAVTVETETMGEGFIGLVNAMASIVALASGVVLGKYLMRPFVGHLNGTNARRNRRR